MLTEKLVSKRIAEARKEKGFSQKKLAEELKVTEQTVVRWETGKSTNIGSELLMDISKVLNVSIDWLLGLSDIKNPDPCIQITCKTTGLSEKTVETIQTDSHLAESTNYLVDKHCAFMISAITSFLVTSEQLQGDEENLLGIKMGGQNFGRLMSCLMIARDKVRF